MALSEFILSDAAIMKLLIHNETLAKWIRPHARLAITQIKNCAGTTKESAENGWGEKIKI